MISAFFSDPHFGHRRICELAKRPFKSVNEMDETLIKNYNDMIGQDDTVVWLGDCFLTGADRKKELMSVLHGRKLLVIGNHDKSISGMARIGFDIVVKQCVTHIAGRTCRLSHYPYRGTEAYIREENVTDRYEDRRPPRYKGEVLIHGHTHSKRRIFQNMINVCCDAWDYKPVMFHEVVTLIEANWPVKA